MILSIEQPEYRTLPLSIKTAATFTARLRGLMFRRKPLNKEGLWIKPCNSIHMCFMFFPIDVVFLDKNNQIIKLVHNLQPWKFIKPVKGAYSVLELPVSTIKTADLQLGGYIRL